MWISYGADGAVWWLMVAIFAVAIGIMVWLLRRNPPNRKSPHLTGREAYRRMRDKHKVKL